MTNTNPHTHQKAPEITVLNLIQDFLDFLEDDEEEIPDEIKELIAASVSHGVAAAINCIMHGYEKEDGTVVPVIASELFEEAFEVATAYLTSEDDEDDEDEEFEDIDEGSGESEPLEGASAAQVDLDEQLDSSGNEPKQGWIQFDNSSKKKAN